MGRGSLVVNEFRWLGRRNKLLTVFRDAEYQQLTTWLEAHPVIKELQRNIKELKYSDRRSGDSSPFTIIRQHCEDAARRVGSDAIAIAVHGPPNAGKSSLCNLLLGRNILPGM